MKQQNVILGIDVGATGIKGGLVDVDTGQMLTERERFDTPASYPSAMAATVQKLVDHFKYQGPVGVGFPAIIRRGVAVSASNIADSWIGTDVTKVFGKQTGLPFYAVNDADAAGIATMAFGTGKPFATDGTVLMLTIGTGLGGALFVDGELMPNLEIGHIYLKNQKVVAEKYISNKVRKDNNMSWAEFGKRLGRVLKHIDFVFNPDLIVLGGGASKNFEEYKQHIKTHAEVKPASMRNTAGTVGAALYAAKQSSVVR